jgi:hypothetical protein
MDDCEIFKIAQSKSSVTSASGSRVRADLPEWKHSPTVEKVGEIRLILGDPESMNGIPVCMRFFLFSLPAVRQDSCPSQSV